jgi:pyruvate dehydrogenase E1 component alpha subunit
VAAAALDAIIAGAEAEMSAARDAALAAPWPDPATAWTDVLDADRQEVA